MVRASTLARNQGTGGIRYDGKEIIDTKAFIKPGLQGAVLDDRVAP
jgi:hypothetical protein